MFARTHTTKREQRYTTSVSGSVGFRGITGDGIYEVENERSKLLYILQKSNNISIWYSRNVTIWTTLNI